jgi:AraC-like DNA-binding protein
MSESGAYGKQLADRLHSESFRLIVSRTLRKGVVGLTEIRSEHPMHAVSDPIPREDAFLVALQLRDFPDHQYWEDGRQAPVFSLRAGSTTIYDLKRSPAFLMDKPFHSVHFYFSRNILNGIADDANAPRIGDLRYDPGKGIEDPIMRALTSSLYPALERPEHANRMFVDHVMLAVGNHVAQAYGGLEVAARAMRGGLTPWQERRAKEIIDANLEGEISLAELAKECGLSASHFSRAFKQTTGIAPHQWLLHRRVENAKQLLRSRQSSLSEIALACGFADQSHFTRVFAKLSGTSPAAWRRRFRRDSPQMCGFRG